MTDPTTPPVVFVYSDFVAAYPEFAALSEPQLTGFFNRAAIYFENTTFNAAFANGVPYMTTLMYLLVAHIAQLNAPRDGLGVPAASGSAAAMTVGQIVSASEGSVSVSMAPAGNGASELAAWYAQTRYGYDFWTATAQRRTMHYVPPQPTYLPGVGAYPSPSPWGRWW